LSQFAELESRLRAAFFMGIADFVSEIRWLFLLGVGNPMVCRVFVENCF